MTSPTPADGNLLTTDAAIAEALRDVRRVAVLGVKPESHADQPAHYVAAYLAAQGLDVVPVPTYYPEVKEILGRPVVRELAKVPPPVDLLDVFRRPQDLAAHEADILALRPRIVWLQLGIREDGFAGRLAAAGLKVVQDRCLLVEWRRHMAR